MAKVTVIHEFDYYEERSELQHLIASRDAVNLVHELDQDLRTKLKWGQDEWLTEPAQKFLEELRDKICGSGVLRDYI